MRPGLWRLALAVMAAAAIACRGRQTVKIGWDVPERPPDHYRLFLDGREIKSFPSPPIDPQCNCMMIEVPVERGSHAIRLEACDPTNICSTSAEVRQS